MFCCCIPCFSRPEETQNKRNMKVHQKNHHRQLMDSGDGEMVSLQKDIEKVPRIFDVIKSADTIHKTVPKKVSPVNQ